jgi:hypothetical protein
MRTEKTTGLGRQGLVNIKEEAGKVKGEAKSGGAEKDEKSHSTRPKDESNG